MNHEVEQNRYDRKLYILPKSLDMLSCFVSFTTAWISFIKGGSSVSSCFRLSVFIKRRIAEPREKLYHSFSLSYHMLIEVKSFMLDRAVEANNLITIVGVGRTSKCRRGEKRPNCESKHFNIFNQNVFTRELMTSTKTRA